mgnify:FL=1
MLRAALIHLIQFVHIVWIFILRIRNVYEEEVVRLLSITALMVECMMLSGVFIYLNHLRNNSEPLCEWETMSHIFRVLELIMITSFLAALFTTIMIMASACLGLLLLCKMICCRVND